MATETAGSCPTRSRSTSTRESDPVTVHLGVISDTHGLLRPEALAALAGCTRIVHAGDVGSLAVLRALQAVAPVDAVRGNVDEGAWAEELPLTASFDLGGARVHVVHDLADLDLDPVAAGLAAVVHGHTHRPSIERVRGVLYLNPGSAGPRRFHLPVTVARVRLEGGALNASIVPLEP